LHFLYKREAKSVTGGHCINGIGAFRYKPGSSACHGVTGQRIARPDSEFCPGPLSAKMRTRDRYSVVSRFLAPTRLRHPPPFSANFSGKWGRAGEGQESYETLHYIYLNRFTRTIGVSRCIFTWKTAQDS
jgi:hypothetical protein